jgi:hypothetical protein
MARTLQSWLRALIDSLVISEQRAKSDGPAYGNRAATQLEKSDQSREFAPHLAYFSLSGANQIKHDVPIEANEAMELAFEQPFLIAVRGKPLRHVLEVRR